MPWGSPVEVVAKGSEMAGVPVTFCSGVKATQSCSRSITTS